MAASRITVMIEDVFSFMGGPAPDMSISASFGERRVVKVYVACASKRSA